MHRPESRQQRSRLWTRVAINLEAIDFGKLEGLRHKLLHHGTGKVRQQRFRIGVSLKKTAARSVLTQMPFVARGTGLLPAARNHLLRDVREGIELSLVDRKFDQNVNGLSGHDGEPPFSMSRYRSGNRNFSMGATRTAHAASLCSASGTSMYERSCPSTHPFFTSAIFSSRASGSAR